MKIVTWNINSVRLRVNLLSRLINEFAPDVICLQETKTPDLDFPVEIFQRQGYHHIHKIGMKGYNGVAIISKIPFQAPRIYQRCNRDDCRHIAVKLANGLDIHNVYVPAGGDIPDPDINPKFAHKLSFMEELQDISAKSSQNGTILLGDLNIAPLEHDVWSHRQLLDVVSHTPIEVAAFNRMMELGKWVDSMRHFIPAAEKLYSWWSYRARDWQKSNRGRRLDHILVSPDLTRHLGALEIVKDARGWLPKPSDHVPVMVTFQL